MNQTTSSTVTGLPAATVVVSRALPAAIAGARDVARAFLDSLQLAVGPDTADSVVLVVSELVTNALRHAGGACVLQLTAHPDTIEVAVRDSCPRAPRMRAPDLNGGTGGFGWPMVDRLTRNTTVTPDETGGKFVRAFLPR
ncbi:ATP-binding protein [Streptomyces sp. NPDC099050]|uniref:ATP-binding protein n=1 Tax=Streptomyces sp. NPDC099050 TaxID=3366100 RepID=UPI0037F29A1D